ncbi:MAG: ROK family protein, partial [Bacteroidota bacterium]
IKSIGDKLGYLPNKIGMGTPGVIDPTLQTLKNSNTTCLNGKPLKKDLEALTGIQFEMANDANCFAIAETQLGIVQEKVPNAKVVFGVIMGTGVGGGLVINGSAIYGKHGIGGEWGHIVLDPNGPDCYCGRNGCVEKIIAGPALEKYYTSLTGKQLKLKELVLNREKDADAQKTVDYLIKNFGKALSYIINVIDPDAIVLGGGVGNIDLLYTEGVEEVKKHIFNHTLETPILRPKLGDSAGVFGAALLVK